MNFVEAIKSAFSNYANFKGRAIRSEYWWFFLFVLLVQLLIEITVGPTDDTNPPGAIASIVFSLAIALPNIGLTARRLHDVNRSGWWQLIAFTIIGIPVLLYWLIKKGTDGPNRFGEDRLAALSTSKTADIVT